MTTTRRIVVPKLYITSLAEEVPEGMDETREIWGIVGAHLWQPGTILYDVWKDTYVHIDTMTGTRVAHVTRYTEPE